MHIQMLKHFRELRPLCPAQFANEHLVWSTCTFIAYIPLHIELLLVPAALIFVNFVAILDCFSPRLFSLLYIYSLFVAALQAFQVIIT